LIHVQKISFDDACQIFTGGTPSRTNPEYFGGGVPWVKITDMLQGVITKTDETLSTKGLENSSAKVLPKGTVLISIFATIGRTAILGIEAATNQAIAGVIPRDKTRLDPDYLRYYLDSMHGKLNREARGVAQPNINQGILKALEIPLPPLAEQRRIVDLLSRAEGIINLRKEAEKKATELIPALFIDMFGDPVTNPKKWPMVKFDSFGTCRLGKMLDKKRQLGNSLKPYLRNINVQWDRIDVHDLLEMDFSLEEQKKFSVSDGDVLICEGGDIGRAAIWSSQINECYYQKALHKLTPNLGIVRPDYVVWLMWHLSKRHAFGSSSHATIAHLTGIQLKNLIVPLPPIDSLLTFEKHVDQAHSLRRQQSEATILANDNFETILSRTFSSL